MSTLKASEGWRSSPDRCPDDIADLVTITDPVKRRIVATIANTIIPHTRYENAMRWLQDAANNSGAGLEDFGGTLCGAPGVGKSTLLRMFVSSRGGPFIRSDGSEVRPVLRVVTPSNTSRRSLFDAMLEELGASDLAAGSDKDRKLLLKRQLQVQDVRLVIFDEFSHVVEDRTQTFTKAMAREVKEILSEKRGGCIFVGTLELAKINELYAQIKRRSFGDIELTPFSWDEGEDSEEWSGILEDLPAVLPIKPEVELHEGLLPMLIHQATDGILDNLMKFLARASMYSYDAAREQDPDKRVTDMRLTGASLWEAFEMLRRGSRAPNPFADYKPKRRRRGEIFVQSFALDEEMADEETSGLRAVPKPHMETFAKGSSRC